MRTLRQHGHAVAVRYDRRRTRVVISLNTGAEATFPPALAGAAPADLAKIEITSSGFDVHWPRLEATFMFPVRWLVPSAASRGWQRNSARQVAGLAQNPKRALRERMDGSVGGHTSIPRAVSG